MCRDLGFVRGGVNPKFRPQGGGTREPPHPLNTYDFNSLKTRERLREFTLIFSATKQKQRERKSQKWSQLF